MSYHKFSNLREIFQGDLTSKLIQNVNSKDFMDLPCNYNTTLKINRSCLYNSMCRKPVLIYKATCICCRRFYIENTQQHFKTRINQHVAETRTTANTGKHFNLFAKHFASHFSDNPKKKKILLKNVRQMVKPEIIWQVGRAISCMKTFRIASCRLCMQERLETYKAIKLDKKEGKERKD